MAKITILIEDKANGELDVRFTSDTPMPEDYTQLTLAQVLSARLHDVINRLFEENENPVS